LIECRYTYVTKLFHQYLRENLSKFNFLLVHHVFHGTTATGSGTYDSAAQLGLRKSAGFGGDR
jgi:hypothetical protein